MSENSFEKKCFACGEIFTTNRSNTKYCSDECKRVINIEHSKEYRKNHPEICKELMHNYYLKHKEELNKANAEYKRLRNIKPIEAVKITYSKTNYLIKQGLIQEQDKCCMCGVDDTRLLNHHSSGYEGEFAAYSLMRLCYSCHSKLHHSMRKQEVRA